MPIPTPAKIGETESEGLPIDAKTLAEICVGDISLAEKLLEKFVSQIQEDLRLIDSALGIRDAAQASKISHSLRSAAAVLAVREVQRIAESLEHAAREDRLDQAACCFDQLKDAAARCLAFLPIVRRELTTCADRDAKNNKDRA